MFSQKEHLIDKGLTERQIKAVLFVKEKGKITNSIYREMFEITEKTAFRDLEKLIKLKILKKEGEKKRHILQIECLKNVPIK